MTSMETAGNDNEALRSRVKQLEDALSASKHRASGSAVIPSALMMTPTPFLGSDSVRSESVSKLVDALNRAAHEVETPKPWPRYGSAPASVLKESATTMGSHANTLASLDQSINRFSKRGQLSVSQAYKSGPSTEIRQRQTTMDLQSKSDKMIELLNKLDAKEKQIITLTAENVQLKSKMSKLKSQLKMVITGQMASLQATSTGAEEKENVGNCSGLSSIQKVETLNTKLAIDTQTRIEELKKDAEEKLTQAAHCVESLQKSLEERTNELKEKKQLIKALEDQLAAYKSQSDKTDDSSNPVTPRPVSNNTKSEDMDDSLALKKKLNELTKLYNDSCKTQSEMKATMGQAVQKLKQFMSELDEKTTLLAQSRQENDRLKAHIMVLEKGRITPSCLVTETTGSTAASCFLANSYETRNSVNVDGIILDHAEELLLSTNEQLEQHYLHRTAYLRQAFSRMFQCSSVSKPTTSSLSATEMQALGRVICSLLGIDGQDQKEITDSIGRMATAAAVSNGLLNVFNIFE